MTVAVFTLYVALHLRWSDAKCPSRVVFADERKSCTVKGGEIERKVGNGVADRGRLGLGRAKGRDRPPSATTNARSWGFLSPRDRSLVAPDLAP
jgi:hypothetical protein